MRSEMLPFSTINYLATESNPLPEKYALQVAAQSAADAALLATQRYQSGLIDFQTVLETQRTQLGAQDSVAAIRTDIASDHVRLYKALGGGWQPVPPARAELPGEPAAKTP